MVIKKIFFKQLYIIFNHFIFHNIYLIFAIFYFKMDKDTTEFYERLRLELNNNTSWPTKYLFKFIVPNDQYKIDKVENAFNNMGAVIETKHSKMGKYTSISIHVQMQDAQNIIDKYLEVSTVEGIISL